MFTVDVKQQYNNNNRAIGVPLYFAQYWYVSSLQALSIVYILLTGFNFNISLSVRQFYDFTFHWQEMLYPCYWCISPCSRNEYLVGAFYLIIDTRHIQSFVSLSAYSRGSVFIYRRKYICGFTTSPSTTATLRCWSRFRDVSLYINNIKRQTVKDISSRRRRNWSLPQNLLIMVPASYSRPSMARTGWDHENMFETGVVRANEC